MKRPALSALDAGRARVTYADVRALEIRERKSTTKNGKRAMSRAPNHGIGIRVLAFGCWGSPPPTSQQGGHRIRRRPGTGNRSLRHGARKQEVVLAPEQKYEATWVSPSRSTRSPFPWTATWRFCWRWMRSCALFRGQPGGSLDALRAPAAGLRLHPRQSHRPDPLPDGAGFAALSYKDGELQRPPIPIIRWAVPVEGVRLVDGVMPVENAPRVAEEAVALHAPSVSRRRADLILDSSQLGLQIHESIGHPIELDRVLGSEANYAA